ncbi:MAG TPA: glycoside hydrolase family 2 TIM barrel-domain containing protein [Ignavibacteriales bacterium]|nr:glycoside hydrolase family 2 TIM barrel-domain containing protein [Ignavibacteriales bacterium]
MKRLLLLLALSLTVLAQVQVYHTTSNSIDTSLFTSTSSRKNILFSKNWSIKIKNHKAILDLPIAFSGTSEATYTNYFFINDNDYNKSQFDLFILGLNYTAEISVNDNVIYKHSGGTFPLTINLPKDILKSNANNKIEITVNNDLSPNETIPTKQTHWLPFNTGGIFRDVYIIKKSNTSIAYYDLNSKIDIAKNTAFITIGSKIINYQSSKRDTTINYSLLYQIVSPSNNVIVSYQTPGFQLNNNKERYISNYFSINSPVLWYPNSPNQYKVKLQLISNGAVIDEYNFKIQLYSLNNNNKKLTLNGEDFVINGVTYIPVTKVGYIQNNDQIINDIKLIKNAGFNAVHFTHILPNPMALKYCADNGLLVFVDLPLNSMPESFIENQVSKDRAKSQLYQIINSYKNYTIVAGFGLGSGYLSNSNIQLDFIDELARKVNKYATVKLTYASFIGYDFKKTSNLNFYGIELFNSLPTDEQLAKLQNLIPPYKIIFSPITYTAYKKGMNGYLTQHSYEAQAKFYDEAIDYVNNNKIPGFFINSMFDYRTEFAPIAGGYSKDNILNIGIAEENRIINRITYRVISSKLNNGDRITIPIGQKIEDEPVVFIIIGLILIVAFGYIINSSRKLREDTTRALLRPYNFFSDLRDMRLVMFSHTNIVLIAILSTFSLLLTNLLYYWKNTFLFEKLILSIGNKSLSNLVSLIAWNPLEGFIIILLVLLIKFMLLVFVIKLFSLLLKNKVFLAKIYTEAVWSQLPIILLLPITLVLVKILNFNIINFYLYIILILFFIWNIQRLLQSIYVLFDTTKMKVYTGFFIFIITVFLLTYVYFQFTEKTFDYMIYYIKQSSLL